MDRTRYQFSLYSLLALTTACSVLLSFAKTFPEASLSIVGFGLMAIGPLLFFLGSLLIFHGEIFFRHSKRFAHVYAPLLGLVCIVMSVLFFVFLA
jgi:hypothetical protein